MKKIHFNKKHRAYFLCFLITIMASTACKKQLDVKNPNDPTFGGNVNTEAGLAAYAKGSIYWNGFSNGDGWLGDSYFSLPWGYHELMGDVVGGGQGSNNQTTTMGVPDSFVADPTDPTNTSFTNSAPQALSIIRSFNNAASTGQGNNALYYEWLNMYAMINSSNTTLENLASINLTADKANAVKAWAYWWKGYAYAQIGTLYYAGLIVDHSNTVVSTFVPQTTIIAESNKQLNLALTTLKGISNQGDYSAMMDQIIPTQCKTGLGKTPSTTEFIATINTMLARNIVLNHLSPFVNGNPAASISKASIPAMSSADWTAVITYASAGVQKGANVFTGRSSTSNSFFSATAGTVASICASSNQNTTYKVSERLIQAFPAGDKRLANFSAADGTFYGDANTNTTRWSLVDGVTAGLTGIPVLGSRQVGGIEVYIGPTYEENALMLAEANIRSGNVAAGVALIDAVRTYQGAGLAPLSTSLTVAQAMTELTNERYAGLAFRGLSYYDARRWGWTYGTAVGGGRYGATLIFNKVVYNNAKINYNFMDYWDVPGDETEKNAPGTGSSAVKNPNY
ncbi:MAG: RagB/SusD family nutrient uptake outer membrane protein [Bacteroidota bacterium]